MQIYMHAISSSIPIGVKYEACGESEGAGSGLGLHMETH